MREIWLLPNRRVLWISMVLPGCVTVASGIAIGLTLHQGWTWFRFVSLLVGGWGLLGTLLLWRSIYVPRLAYEDGDLLVYLRAGAPIRVPIEVVEVFFLGQASAEVAEGAREASTVVVRLAERAKDWHEANVRPALGEWTDGYITIRGTWCEPLRPELLQQLNKRLAAIRRERAASEKGSQT